MPRKGIKNSFLAYIEDLTAELLAARDALIELESFILANRQYGHLSESDYQLLIGATDKARRGVQIGIRLAKLCRTPPPDLDGLRKLIESWVDDE